jgi:hypothetical protein
MPNLHPTSGVPEGGRGVVLVAVLEADLGAHRKIGWFRIVRPLLMAAAIAPLYLTALTTRTSPGRHCSTATLVLTAVAMVLTRTLGMAARATTLPQPEAVLAA